MAQQPHIESLSKMTYSQATNRTVSKWHPLLFSTLILPFTIFLLKAAEESIPKPQFIPLPGEASTSSYSPKAILPGGIVIALYPPESPMLNQDRKNEAEIYTMSGRVPGRVNHIVNIHNPSIEFHPAGGNNTGTTVLLLAGGGHKRLIVGPEACDPIPFFYNYGINSVIVRNRLRADGYIAEKDAVNDTLQAIRLVRSHAKTWKLDPAKIGVMGFSAGAELASAAALFYDKFDSENSNANDPLANVPSRPDFVALIYPGPTPFTKSPKLEFPKDTPPTFIASASYGDARHTIWANDYYMAMLKRNVPNIEMHLYGNGWHGGALSDRGGIPFGTWQFRYIDWFRDLGFLKKPGLTTKAAADIQKSISEQ